MRITMNISWYSVIFLFWVAQAHPQEEIQSQKANSCVSCHLEMGDELAVPVERMKEDVHAAEGLSCADCHGGDPEAGLDGDLEESMDPAKGYIGVPKRTEVPQFCAKCHSDQNYMRRYNPLLATDQHERYKASIHGKLLKKRDTKVATCIDCHGVHGILTSKDSKSLVHPDNVPITCGGCHADPDYMQDYHIPTDQLSEYKTSVHGIALLERGDHAAPACNDCHGNHGDSPPQAPSIAFVCGQCHLNNSEMFLKSPHRDAFEILELPACETCHGNHGIQHPSDDMLTAGDKSVCLDCHEDDSKGYITAVAMHQQIGALSNKLVVADSLVSTAEHAGMQVSEAKFMLHDADDALVKARTLVHSLSVSQTTEMCEEGASLVDEALRVAQTALVELRFRRKGLAVSIVFILILAAGIYMKIREMDKKYPVRHMS